MKTAGAGTQTIVNEQSKSIWKKPWKGPRALLLWFALLACSVFVEVFSIGWLLSGNPSHLMDLVMLAMAMAVGIALIAMLASVIVRWLFCWCNLRRVLFGIACVATLLALFYAEEDWRGKHAWQSYTREWEARGDKFDLVSLAPKPVPDDQNFALTPLLKPALDFTRVDGKPQWRDSNALTHLQSIGAELAPYGRPNDHLVLGKLDQGTFADLEACRNFYRGNTNYPQPATPGTAANDILVALGKYDAEVKELREAAATRPYCRFPIEYDYDMPAAILLPHLSRIKALSILVQLRAIAELEADRSSEAFEDLKLGFRLSDSIREEPIVIDHLVRIATLGIQLQGLREGLVRHRWSDAQLAELEKYLAALDLFKEYKHAMRGERAFATGILEWVLRQGVKFDASGVFGGDDYTPPLGRSLNFMPSGGYYQNMLTIYRLHEKFTLASVDEQQHRAFPEITANEDQVLNQMRMTPYNIFSKLLFSALGGVTVKNARMQTLVDAARVACAAERYRLANGQLPDTLDALVPRFIEKIPNDVIDGNPLRYRKKADGSYIVYSVGWNQTDDGGTLAWTTGKPPSINIRKGDWVWQ